MKDLNVKCIVSGKDTEGKIAIFEEIVAPESGPPLHLHKEQYEIFHIISGAIEFEIESERIEALPGKTVVVPPGTKHSFINKSKEKSVIHFDLLPAGDSEAFFEKLMYNDFEDIEKLFDNHGLKLCGPPIRLHLL